MAMQMVAYLFPRLLQRPERALFLGGRLDLGMSRQQGALLKLTEKTR